MAKELRGGYTTGACMAAGVKAALHYFLKKERLEKLTLAALDDTLLVIPVKNVTALADGSVQVEIVKDAGDDPDITNGASVFTTVSRQKDGSGLVFLAGEGIGRVTKPGLSVPVGEAAINPGPKKLVEKTVREMLGEKADLQVKVAIPNGEELAKRTLNPILGVVGGLSIIGTTGVLRPMSEEGFKNSLVPQIDVALAAGHSSLVFVPGKMGQTQAIRRGFLPETIVQTSNFIGFMLEKAAEKEVKEIILFGHIGKLAKVAAGVFHTHNRVGDGRLETMAAYGALLGLPSSGVEKVLKATTTEEAMAVFSEHHLEKTYYLIAKRASERAERLVFGKVKIGTALVTLKGEILGFDAAAQEIANKIGGKLDEK